MRLLPALALAALTALTAQPATIVAYGTWNPGTPTTGMTVAGGEWWLTFNLPDPFNVTTSGSSLNTTQASGFQYTLNGTAIPSTLSSITFYTDDPFGTQFSLNLGSQELWFFGPTLMYTGTAPSLTLTPGTYEGVMAGLSDFTVYGFATFEITASGAAVPEPATYLLAVPILGLLALRRRKS